MLLGEAAPAFACKWISKWMQQITVSVWGITSLDENIFPRVRCRAFLKNTSSNKYREHRPCEEEREIWLEWAKSKSRRLWPSKDLWRAFVSVATTPHLVNPSRIMATWINIGYVLTRPREEGHGKPKRRSVTNQSKQAEARTALDWTVRENTEWHDAYLCPSLACPS